jgi:hypothetical protein
MNVADPHLTRYQLGQQRVADGGERAGFNRVESLSDRINGTEKIRKYMFWRHAY